MKELVRVSQVPVGATFKYLNVLYLKTHERKAHTGYKDYEDNCVRLDNNKSTKLHGSFLVEVIK